MNEILHFLNHHKLCKDLSQNTKVQLIPLLEIISFKAREKIFDHKNEATAAYFISDGSAKLGAGKSSEERTKGCFIGEEACFGIKNYISEVKGKQAGKLVKIPQEALEIIKSQNDNFYSTFFSSFTDAKPLEKQIAIKSSPTRQGLWRTGWFFSALIPLLVYFLIDSKIPSETKLFLSILSSGLVLWISNIFHECIPGLIIVAATLILGLVPPENLLSGFGSASFLSVLSLWALGLLLVESQLTQRALLYLTRYLPSGSSWHNLSLFLMGGMMTPAIPSVVNRAKVGGPIVSEAMNILRVQPHTSLSTKISASVFFGVTTLSSIFFTGSSMNFIVFGLLSLQDQQTIQTIGWITCSFTVGVILMMFYIIASSIFFSTREKFQISRNIIDMQIQARGPMTQIEWLTLGIVTFFIASVFTIQYHRIPLEWLSLFTLFIILSTHLVDIRKWQTETDWSFLIFLATIIGINKAIHYMKVDALFLDTFFSLLKSYISKNNLSDLILWVIGLTIIIRLVIPIGPSIALLSSIMVPIAEYFGLNLWVLGFVLLVTADIWWFPYQSAVYMRFVESFSKGIPYKQTKFLIFNALMNFARIAAIYLSIPYWKSLGLVHT